MKKQFNFQESNGKKFKFKTGTAWYDQRWDYNLLYSHFLDICLRKFYNRNFAAGLDCTKEYRKLTSAYIHKTFLANAEESFNKYLEWRDCHYFYDGEWTLWCIIDDAFDDDQWFIDMKSEISENLWKEFVKYQLDYCGEKWLIEKGLESELIKA